MTQSTICLIIFAITIVCYVSNKWPLALVSLTSMIAMTLFGCLTPQDALGNFANSSVIIMGAMMVIAAGLNRTQMIHKVTNLVYKVSGGSFTKGMLGYCLVTFAMAQVMPSSIVVFTICAPLVADFCRKSGKSPAAGLFSVCLISITSVCAMPVGSGAANYMMVNSQLEAFGFSGYEAHMFDFFIIKIPSLIVSIICGAFICPKFAPDNGPLLSENEKKAMENKIAPLDPVREFFGYGIFLAVVICMLLGDRLPLQTWQICVAGALMVLITGVLNEKEALSSIMLSPIFLLVGALGIGKAVSNSGAGDVLTSFIQNILGADPNPWVVTIVLWLTAFIVTQFMSNMALMTAMGPLVYLLCLSYNWNPIGLVYMVNTACFISYLTPLSTVTVPYMMSVGGYTQKDLMRMGWIPAILVTLVTVPWVMLVFPPC
mgnify:CR=1 FL=1